MNDTPDSGTEVKHQISTATSLLFDAAVIVGFISAAAYLVGYAYFSSYMTGMSLKPQFIHVASIHYMWFAFIMFSFVALIIAPAIFFASEPATSFISAAKGNYPVVVYVMVLAFIAFNHTDALAKWWYIFLAVIVTILVLYKSYRKESIAHRVYSGSAKTRVLSVIAGVFFTALIAGQFGTMRAKRLLDDESRAASSIRLIDKSGNSLLGEGKWILVFITDSSYVVVQQNDSTAEFPIAHMVNKSDVSIAKIGRIE